MSNVIVFGPTGKVGSVAALTAKGCGSKVFLAMRDTKKPTPSLDGFEKVEADLSKPETVAAAVKKTGAKRAFIYMVMGGSDNMKSTIEALKSGGIEYVVFLSSGSVKGDIRKIPKTPVIPWLHAQVEVNLEEIYGNNFVAVRPLYFATNSFWWKKMIQAGEVKMAYPEAKLDWISNGDIGRTCGMFLAGKLGGHRDVFLVGPELVSMEDAVGIIAESLGKKVKVVKVDEKEDTEQLMANSGMPEPMARNVVVDVWKAAAEGKLYDESYHEAVKNFAKFVGSPTSFPAWVAENKSEFE